MKTEHDFNLVFSRVEDLEKLDQEAIKLLYQILKDYRGKYETCPNAKRAYQNLALHLEKIKEGELTFSDILIVLPGMISTANLDVKPGNFLGFNAVKIDFATELQAFMNAISVTQIRIQTLTRKVAQQTSNTSPKNEFNSYKEESTKQFELLSKQLETMQKEMLNQSTLYQQALELNQSLLLQNQTLQNDLNETKQALEESRLELEESKNYSNILNTSVLFSPESGSIARNSVANTSAFFQPGSKSNKILEIAKTLLSFLAKDYPISSDLKQLKSLDEVSIPLAKQLLNLLIKLFDKAITAKELENAFADVVNENKENKGKLFEFLAMSRYTFSLENYNDLYQPFSPLKIAEYQALDTTFRDRKQASAIKYLTFVYNDLKNQNKSLNEKSNLAPK